MITLQMLIDLTQNLIDALDDPLLYESKRTIRLRNVKIKRSIVDVKGAIDYLSTPPLTFLLLCLSTP